MESYRDSAKKWLGFLRAGTDQYDSMIGYVREDVRKGNLSLADIGTSEEDLEQIRVNCCKITAKKWLDILRRRTTEYDLAISCVLDNARKGNLSLADIGASEKGLEQLRVKNCEFTARKWLGFLRDGSDQCELKIECILENVRKGGFSLASIGTSEEELESFRLVKAKT